MEGLVAKDIMNRDVMSVGREWSIEHLADFLIENSISGAPVISEDGKLLGVVSLTDIVRYRCIPAMNGRSDGTQDTYIHAPERIYPPSEIETYRVDSESLVTVGDIMTPVTFTVPENTTIPRIADSMIAGRIHRVFVTRKEKLVGIITTIDILKILKDF